MSLASGVVEENPGRSISKVCTPASGSFLLPILIWSRQPKTLGFRHCQNKMAEIFPSILETSDVPWVSRTQCLHLCPLSSPILLIARRSHHVIRNLKGLTGATLKLGPLIGLLLLKTGVPVTGTGSVPGQSGSHSDLYPSVGPSS